MILSFWTDTVKGKEGKEKKEKGGGRREKESSHLYR